MFNPNSNSQMAESLRVDLSYLGMIVSDLREVPDYVTFKVRNSCITFGWITCIDGKCNVRTNGKIHTITYKGSLERLSEDVITYLVKKALAGAR